MKGEKGNKGEKGKGKRRKGKNLYAFIAFNAFVKIKGYKFGNYPRNDSNRPAATAEPTTPATFGPMACIRRKFEGFSS